MKRLASYFGKQWYAKFVSLFTAIIMYSCLFVFEGYWWLESFQIAYFTLLCAVVINFVLPDRMRLLRWALQFAATICVVFRFARIEWDTTAVPMEGGDDSKVLALLDGLHPFIWIGLSLWLIHLLFSLWAQSSRVRMFGVVGAGLLMLTIADSFTPIWLWDDVAVVVFVGLIWLVLSHLDRLQRTHPDSWKELLGYPIRVITPAIVLLSLFLVIVLYVPSIAPILQDPYTIWKNARGEQVQVFLGEKSMAGNEDLDERNASSGYGRNDDMLGGGFNYDFSPVMTISTSQRSYWRGESKSLYTGQGWIDGDLNEPVQFVSQFNELYDGGGRDKAELVNVSQIVSMIREEPYPVLFGAAPVSTVNWVENDTTPIPAGLAWSADNWELIWDEQFKYPTTYSVTSAVVTLDEEALRGAESRLADAEDSAKYLSIPSTVPDRVHQLAAEVTAEGANDYDKAKLLESYLKTTFAYNNKPDLTKRKSKDGDFVDQFLFEMKEGYCDYFSTAMAVMARSLDMPSRWVKGFSPGVLPADRYGPPSDIMDGEEYNPRGAGTYTVRNSDAHSWVEIYFEGYGWIPFEPTSGFSFPYTTPEGEETVLPEVDTNEPAESVDKAVQSSAGSAVWGWIGIAVVVAGAGAAWLFISRKKIGALWRRVRHGAYTTNDQIVLETNRLLRFCQKRGLQREEHETIREAVTKWLQGQNRLKDDFRTVLDGFEVAKYGSTIASKEEADRFVSKVRYLIGELK
ncbi:DUF4129 domain-containing transglutaminase family protein [Paenibacillus sp. GCM10027627]|uniref:DUF4129 domain-containing transglutaminase family protein n=1 Tax=unclassified Paenibacillus TaxID=185978 RepID=UPI0036406F23